MLSGPDRVWMGCCGTEQSARGLAFLGMNLVSKEGRGRPESCHGCTESLLPEQWFRNSVFPLKACAVPNAESMVLDKRLFYQQKSQVTSFLLCLRQFCQPTGARSWLQPALPPAPCPSSRAWPHASFTVAHSPVACLLFCTHFLSPELIGVQQLVA